MAMAKPSKFKPFSPPPLPPKPSSNHSSGASDHSRSPSGTLNDLDIVGSCNVVPPPPPTRHTSVHQSRLERTETINASNTQVDKAIQADVSNPAAIESTQSHCCCRLDFLLSSTPSSNGHAGCISSSASCCCNTIILPCCAFNNLQINNHHHPLSCARSYVAYDATNDTRRPSSGRGDATEFSGSSQSGGERVSVTLPIRSKTPPARVSRIDHHKDKAHHKSHKGQQQPDIVTSHDNSLSSGSRPSSGSSSKKSRWSRALAKFLPTSNNHAAPITTTSSDNQSFTHPPIHTHEKASAHTTTSPHPPHSSSSRRSRSLNRMRNFFQLSSANSSTTTTITTSATTASSTTAIATTLNSAVAGVSVATSTHSLLKSTSKLTDTAVEYQVMTNPPTQRQVHHHQHSRSHQALPKTANSISSRKQPVRSSAPNTSVTTTQGSAFVKGNGHSQANNNRVLPPPPRRSNNLPASGPDSGSSSSSSPIQSHRVIQPSVMQPPTTTSSHTGSDSSMASCTNNSVEHTTNGAGFAESMRRIKRMAWYWGPLSTDEAESLLETCPDGTFLVRDSAHDSYILSVSFRAQNKTYHVRVEHTREYACKFGCKFYGKKHTLNNSTITGKQLSDSILENTNGIESYIVSAIEQSTRSNLGLVLNDAESLPVGFLYPLSRNQAVQSLQHLCRFEILCRVRHDHIDHLTLPKSLLAYLKQKQYYTEFIDKSSP